MTRRRSRHRTVPGLHVRAGLSTTTRCRAGSGGAKPGRVDRILPAGEGAACTSSGSSASTTPPESSGPPGTTPMAMAFTNPRGAAGRGRRQAVQQFGALAGTATTDLRGAVPRSTSARAWGIISPLARPRPSFPRNSAAATAGWTATSIPTRGGHRSLRSTRRGRASRSTRAFAHALQPFRRCRRRRLALQAGTVSTRPRALSSPDPPVGPEQATGRTIGEADKALDDLLLTLKSAADALAASRRHRGSRPSPADLGSRISAKLAVFLPRPTGHRVRLPLGVVRFPLPPTPYGRVPSLPRVGAVREARRSS